MQKRIWNPIKIGDRIGKLIVIEELEERNSNGSKKYLFKCECGATRISSSSEVRRKKIKDCGCWRLEEKRKHIGERIAGLEIIDVSSIKPNDYNWIAICKCVCGNVKEIRYCDIKSGKNKTCGCRMVNTKTGYVKSLGKFNRCWTGYEEISGSFLRRIKESAKIRGYKFKVTPVYIWNLYLKQSRKCALSGLDLIFSSKSNQTASLDRIDSSMGYIEGNVQWVHKDINNMKQDYSQEYFIEICSKISKLRETRIN